MSGTVYLSFVSVIRSYAIKSAYVGALIFKYVNVF